eukprot:366119-Chlamydomonas_euryale.AAC.43
MPCYFHALQSCAPVHDAGFADARLAHKRQLNGMVEAARGTRGRAKRRQRALGRGAPLQLRASTNDTARLPEPQPPGLLSPVHAMHALEARRDSHGEGLLAAPPARTQSVLIFFGQRAVSQRPVTLLPKYGWNRRDGPQRCCAVSVAPTPRSAGW